MNTSNVIPFPQGKFLGGLFLLFLVCSASIGRGQILISLAPQDENESFVAADAVVNANNYPESLQSQGNTFTVTSLSPLNQTETASASSDLGTSSASATLSFDVEAKSITSSFSATTSATGVQSSAGADFGFNLFITTTQAFSYDFAFSSSDQPSGDISAFFAGGPVSNYISVAYDSLGNSYPSNGDARGVILPGTYQFQFQGGRAPGGIPTSEDSLNGNDYMGSASVHLTFSPAAPEPSTWALMLGGLGLLAFWRLRTRRPKA